MEKPLRILVVEDNLLNQKVTSAFIDHLGHRCVVIADGLEALKRFRIETFDVALIDIQLPGLNGIELVRSLHRRAQETTHDVGPLPRLVALTALVRADGNAFYSGHGFDSHLAKPLSIAALQAELDQV